MVYRISEGNVLGWQDKPEILQMYSYKRVNNAWSIMCWGGCLYGIHQSVPGEIVHVVQLGVMPRVLDCLLCTKALTGDQQKAKAKLESKLPVTEKATDTVIDYVEDPDKEKKATKEIQTWGIWGSIWKRGELHIKALG